MAKKTVTITIDETGENVSVDMVGYKGKGCKDVAKAFDSLGKITKETTKPEFFHGPGAGNQVTVGS